MAVEQPNGRMNLGRTSGGDVPRTGPARPPGLPLKKPLDGSGGTNPRRLWRAREKRNGVAEDGALGRQQCRDDFVGHGNTVVRVGRVFRGTKATDTPYYASTAHTPLEARHRPSPRRAGIPQLPRTWV